MVFVVAFVPKGTTDIPQPDWAAQLPTLGAADGGNVAPSTTIVGATTIAPTGTDGRRRDDDVDRPDETPPPPPRRRRPPPQAADARRRPGRRFRNATAPTDADHAQTDVAGRARPDHRTTCRQPRQGWRHRGDAGPRVQAGALRRSISRPENAMASRCTTPSSRSHSTPPGRSSSPPSSAGSTTRSWSPTAMSSPISTSQRSSTSTDASRLRRPSTSSASTTHRRSVSSPPTQTARSTGSSRSRRREPRPATRSTAVPTCSSHPFCTAYRAGSKVSIERATFPDVVAGGRLYAMATDDYWLDTGNPALYLQANLDLLDGTRNLHTCAGIHDGARVHPTASVHRSVVGDGATVGAGADITDSVLLAGAVVDDGATVTNSVIMGTIGSGASRHRCGPRSARSGRVGRTRVG